MAIRSNPDPVAWTNLVTIAAVQESDVVEGIKAEMWWFHFDFGFRFSVGFLKQLESVVKPLRLRKFSFHFATSIERDSMPPEMLRALKPFCRRMRIA